MTKPIDKAAAHKRSAMMADLRKQNLESVKETQLHVKSQNTIRRALKRSMKTGPHTISEMAEQTEMTKSDVLWHVSAMLRYGIVVEAGMDEDEEYYMYSLAKGVR